MRRALLLATVLLAGCGTGDAPRPSAGAPAPAAAPFRAAADAPARARTRGHLVARIDRATPLRARPRGRVLGRIGRRTEFGTRTTLAVTRRRGPWLQVITPLLDNGDRGWIRADAARVGATPYSVQVDRSARRAIVRRGRRTVLRFAVAVGRPGNETPLGRFAVTDELHPSDATSPYGCCAVALSGHQTRLEPGWPGGDRLAIHGTPQPETVGRPVSLGCMRAHRRPLERLMRLVPVGTPVTIRA
jgi:hypothetical protein